MTATPLASKTDLAVIIVTWNNAAVIGDALRSLTDDLRESSLRYQVCVVDSGSSDRTLDIIRGGFPDVQLIENKVNIGFAAANNLAMRALGFGRSQLAPQKPAVVYLLNPDTITHQGATKRLYEALMARPDVESSARG